MLAELVDAVVGVDTHRDTHQVEIALPTGAPIATTTIGNNSRGYAQLLGWIGEHAPGPRVVLSVEGTRSYGLGLTRAVTAAGLPVLEAEQPTRTSRRGRGKSDPIDAHLAVTFALRRDIDRLPTPRADGDREALRILLGARDDLTTITTAQINALRALLRDGGNTPTTTSATATNTASAATNTASAGTNTGDGDRRLARSPLTDTVLTGLARRRPPREATRVQAIRQGEIRRLAVAIRQARRDLATNHAHLAAIVDELAPGLTQRPGIGPVSAAQIIVSYSHPGRIHSEAAFAALAGVNPIPASSGKTTRHRLNRGGDRRLNRALHTIAVARMTHDPRTRTYLEHRRGQQKTDRDIRRSLKRYIARELYRTLNTIMTNPATTAA